MALPIIDVDQHLFESRTTWSEFIEPAHRADALSITDDQGGWPWLTWRDERLTPLEVPIPERSSQKPIATHRFLERDNPQARSALVVFEAAPPSSAPDTTVSIIIKGTDARLSSQTR